MMAGPTPRSGVEAWVTVGDHRITFEDILRRLTHFRGFGMATSYCIVEVSHTQHEILTQVMNHGIFQIKYGRNQDYTETINMQLVSVDNSIEFSNVKSRFIGVEPGFVRLAERSRIKSYPDSTVSNVFGRLAFENDIDPRSIQQTTGQYTFVQPNVSDLFFLQKYMLPLATTPSNDTPFQFTIDEGIMYLIPPNLGQAPIHEAVLDSSINTNVKRFSVKNDGFSTDFAFGTNYLNYGYDFVSKGLLQHEEFISSVNSNLLNQKPYESNFNRDDVTPYEKKWMVDAHNKNKMGAAAFNILGEAVVEGRPNFTFNQKWRFSIPLQQADKAEYSGDYYVHSVAHVMEPRLYVTHLNLRSNSFLRGHKIGESPT